MVGNEARTVMVRHRNGILQDMDPDEAQRLLKAGVVELAGAPAPTQADIRLLIEVQEVNSKALQQLETAMLAPPETAMLPPAQPRTRTRPRKPQTR